METNEIQIPEEQLVTPTAENAENQASDAPQDIAGTEHHPEHHHHHSSALGAASMGHSAVDHVMPHHSTHLDN